MFTFNFTDATRQLVSLQLMSLFADTYNWRLSQTLHACSCVLPLGYMPTCVRQWRFAKQIYGFVNLNETHVSLCRLRVDICIKISKHFNWFITRILAFDLAVKTETSLSFCFTPWRRRMPQLSVLSNFHTATEISGYNSRKFVLQCTYIIQKPDRNVHPVRLLKLEKINLQSVASQNNFLSYLTRYGSRSCFEENRIIN
jgi:hypothetical protein